MKKFDFQMVVSKKRFSFGKFYVEIRNQHTQIDVFHQSKFSHHVHFKRATRLGGLVETIESMKNNKI